MLEQYFSNIWHKSKSEQFTVFFLTWDHPLPTIQWGELRQYGHIVCSNKDYLFHFKGLKMGIIVFLQKETGTKSVVMAMTMCFLWCDVMWCTYLMPSLKKNTALILTWLCQYSISAPKARFHVYCYPNACCSPLWRMQEFVCIAPNAYFLIRDIYFWHPEGWYHCL